MTQNRAILILQMRCVARWRIRAVRDVGCLASGDRQPATLAGRRPARAAASVGTYPLIRHRHRQRQHRWAGLIASSHGHCRLHYRPGVTLANASSTHELPQLTAHSSDRHTGRAAAHADSPGGSRAGAVRRWALPLQPPGAGRLGRAGRSAGCFDICIGGLGFAAGSGWGLDG